MQGLPSRKLLPLGKLSIPTMPIWQLLERSRLAKRLRLHHMPCWLVLRHRFLQPHALLAGHVRRQPWASSLLAMLSRDFSGR